MGPEIGTKNTVETPRRKIATTKPEPFTPETTPIEETSETPERKKPGHKKLKLVAELAGILFFVANAGMGVKYHVDFETPNTPAGIMQDIKGIPTEWQYTIVKWQNDKANAEIFNKPVSLIYDNQVDDQLIQAGVNAASVSRKELPSLLQNSVPPVIKGQFPNPTILLPLRLTDGEKVDIETYWVKGAYNPINPESKDPIAYGKNIRIANKNTEIIVPVENATVLIATTDVNGKAYINELDIKFKGSDDTIYNLAIRSPEDVRGLQFNVIITNALTSGKKSVDVPLNTTIATTSSDNLELTIRMFTGEPVLDTNIFGANPSSANSLYCNYNLLTKTENGKTVLAFLPQDSS